ncbi:glycosyltransferase 87 family protein [Nocardia altamirensis]|uniref:glycosyltransferase 87 family protein n=1 Tax=Nocardia altamirensis TaxID=472158 RepID=UPI001FDEEB08|nr:glycosyltransferase 87 family protein [Nocardia altamirensis]
MTASAVLAVILLFTTVDPWLDRAGFLAGGLDVHVYRDGAWRILHGEPLYTEPTVLGLLYTYTPFSTIAFLPIVLIPWAYVTNTWMVFNLTVLFACVLLSFRLLGYRLNARLAVVSALLASTCAFIEPVRTTLFYGQINLVLMLLVLWDFARADRSTLRGIGVGLGAGIKLVPAFFIAQFVFLRQWRAAGTAAVVFVASVALAWLVLPEDSRKYWTSTFFQSTRIGDDTHPSNQSLRGAIAHLTHKPAPVWLWLLIAGLVAVAGLWVASGLYQRGERLLAVTLAGLTACAVSPFSWDHHWVWFVPLLVYLVHHAQTRWQWWIAAALLWAAIGAWTWEYDPDYVVVGLFLFPPWWTFAQVLINSFVIIYAVVLAGAIALLVRRRSGCPTVPEDVPAAV